VIPDGGTTPHGDDRIMSEQTGTTSQQDPGQTQQPPAPGRGPGYRRLVRRVDHKMIAGVAAGLGDYFAVDPVLFRVLFVVLTVAGGLGIFLYGLLWWITPAAGGEGLPDPGRRGFTPERVVQRLKASPTWVGIVLLVIGGLAVANGIGFWHPAIFWGVVLIALGVLLFRQAEGREGSRLPTADLPSQTSLPGTAGGPMLPPPAGSAYGGAPLPPPGGAIVGTAPSPPRRRRQRSALGWITVGALIIGLGVAALLDSAGTVNVAPGQYVALALGVLGLGLLVGAWWGRARWLIIPGVLLIPAVLVASLVDVPLRGGFGQRFFRPQATADVPTAYRLSAGEIQIDLRQLAVQAQPVDVTATVGAGHIEVFAPAGVQLVVHARAGAGQITLLGVTYAGIRVSVDRTFGPSGLGSIVLDLRTGLGAIDVYRAPGSGVKG